MKKKVLFICTGNYYRSRFAEIWFNDQAEKRNLLWEAFSRGFKADNPFNTGFISPLCTIELEKRKLNWSERMPVKLTENDLKAAELVIALNRSEHMPLTQILFPEWKEKIIFWHVNDIDVEEPCSAISALELLLQEFITGFE